MLQDARDVVIRMWPHAAIAGLVVNGEGTPVSGALVTLLEYASGTPLGTPASWRSVSDSTTRTDGTGTEDDGDSLRRAVAGGQTDDKPTERQYHLETLDVRLELRMSPPDDCNAARWHLSDTRGVVNG